MSTERRPPILRGHCEQDRCSAKGCTARVEVVVRMQRSSLGLCAHCNERRLDGATLAIEGLRSGRDG